MSQLADSPGRVLGRLNMSLVAGIVLKALYVGRSSVVWKGSRVVPKRLLARGFDLSYPREDLT